MTASRVGGPVARGLSASGDPRHHGSTTAKGEGVKAFVRCSGLGLVLEGPFLPVLGPLSVLLFTAAQVWFGLTLARSGDGAQSVERLASSRSRSRAEIR